MCATELALRGFQTPVILSNASSYRFFVLVAHFSYTGGFGVPGSRMFVNFRRLDHWPGRRTLGRIRRLFEIPPFNLPFTKIDNYPIGIFAIWIG